MKAIILAAGSGRRLKPYTDDRPKCLLEINDETLLGRQLRLFRDLGITDITVVRGYRGNQISYPGIKYYDNADFKNTNMVHSLFLAQKELSGEVLVSYGDLVFNPRVIRKIISSPEDVTVCVDDSWREYWQARFGSVAQDLESLTLDAKRETITSLGREVSSPVNIHARYVGLIKLSATGCHIFRNMFRQARIKYRYRPWPASGKNFSRGYMTDLLQEIITSGFAVHAAIIHRGWLELDNVADLEQSRWLFSKFINAYAN